MIPTVRRICNACLPPKTCGLWKSKIFHFILSRLPINTLTSIKFMTENDENYLSTNTFDFQHRVSILIYDIHFKQGFFLQKTWSQQQSQYVDCWGLWKKLKVVTQIIFTTKNVPICKNLPFQGYMVWKLILYCETFWFVNNFADRRS